jgi:hypothetical protein
MTTPSDVDLAAFVATSAAILGLQLDDQAQASVLDAMRGLMGQAALVLDHPKPPTGSPIASPAVPPTAT